MNYQDTKRLMKHPEAMRLLKDYDEASNRKANWDGIKHSSAPTKYLVIDGFRMSLSNLEYKMICNILDNTINERHNNLKERLEKELNITVEV
jgi:hypothetical protein